jgi:hypothetical protein
VHWKNGATYQRLFDWPTREFFAYYKVQNFRGARVRQEAAAFEHAAELHRHFRVCRSGQGFARSLIRAPIKKLGPHASPSYTYADSRRNKPMA